MGESLRKIAETLKDIAERASKPKKVQLIYAFIRRKKRKQA